MLVDDVVHTEGRGIDIITPITGHIVSTATYVVTVIICDSLRSLQSQSPLQFSSFLVSGYPHLDIKRERVTSWGVVK